jgi:hypothetical protein
MKRRTIIGLVFIVAALIKLACMWNILHFDWLLQKPWTDYFNVFLILCLGIEFIISSYHHDPDQWLQRPLPTGEEGKRICCSAHYGGDAYVYHGEPFHGARLDAICGGIRLDLREAAITEDEEIDIHTFLGGIELIVPENVNIVVKSRNFIGSVGNHARRATNPAAPSLHIVASNFFGGVDIRNNLV